MSNYPANEEWGRLVAERVITGWRDLWEGGVDYEYALRSRPVYDLRLYRVTNFPKYVKREVLGPIPGGRWWAVGEIGHSDLPDMNIINIGLGKLMRAGCRVFLSDPRQGWKFFEISGPSDPIIDKAWGSYHPWAAYVVGHRGGLALPPHPRHSS